MARDVTASSWRRTVALEACEAQGGECLTSLCDTVPTILDAMDEATLSHCGGACHALRALCIEERLWAERCAAHFGAGACEALAVRPRVAFAMLAVAQRWSLPLTLGGGAAVASIAASDSAARAASATTPASVAPRRALGLTPPPPSLFTPPSVGTSVAVISTPSPACKRGALRGLHNARSPPRPSPPDAATQRRLRCDLAQLMQRGSGSASPNVSAFPLQEDLGRWAGTVATRCGVEHVALSYSDGAQLPTVHVKRAALRHPNVEPESRALDAAALARGCSETESVLGVLLCAQRLLNVPDFGTPPLDAGAALAWLRCADACDAHAEGTPSSAAVPREAQPMLRAVPFPKRGRAQSDGAARWRSPEEENFAPNELLDDGGVGGAVSRMHSLQLGSRRSS